MSNQMQGATNYGTPLLNFQIDSLSIKDKSEFAYGKQVAEALLAQVNGGTSSYFWTRNQRWKVNRNYANGRIPMQQFIDLLEFNGKTNYLNINWQCIKLPNRIISGLVGRWMGRSEKINVTATDSLSTKKKQEEYEELEFYIDNKRMLEQLQQESGVQMIPNDNSLPSDKEELRLWKSQFQRLPEEIGYEMGCNDVLASCGWFDALKEKILFDAAVTGFLATYTWMDAEGVIHVEWLKPENCVYSYSDFEDFRNTTHRGYLRSLKVSELRKKYSKEFNPNNPHALTEEEIFEISKTAKEYQLYDNLTWQTTWNVTFLRPYDEWNVDTFEFEYKSLDREAYTVVKTKKNNSTIIKKGKSPKVKDNEEVIEDSRINIYRGVYVRNTNRILEWGLKKNMIRPQDPKELGNAEFSYSFYMVQNYDMTCLGIPEKIQEPVDQMIIARLKIQQLVMTMRPPGAAINWTAVQNIDYGLGEQNKSIDFKKMFDQTGSFYFHERDAEGNPIGVPFTEIPNAGFLPQLQGLILLYDKHYQIVKDELGEDPNLISQAAQPRVAVQNIEASQQTAEFATDYYYRGYVRVLEDTAKKISCLLKDSVEAGAKVYRHIVGEEDVKQRIFSSRIQLLPDSFQIQKFEALLQKAMDTTPDLVSFLDPFQMMRVAKEDVKLAETLFRQAQKKMIQHQQQMQRENLQMTIEGQQKSAQMAEQEKRETESMKGEIDIKKSQVAGQANNQSAVVNLVATLLKPGTDGVTAVIPPILMPLVNATIQNIMIGAVASSEEQKAAIQQQMQMAQQQQEQPIPEQQNQQPQQPMAA
jgi:hypothetical protein